MRIEHKQSFKKALRKYNKYQQEDIFTSIQTLSNSIEKFQMPKGLGLKLLISKSKIWEARVSIDIRVLFRYESDLLEIAFVGNHDQIKRYLKAL